MVTYSERVYQALADPTRRQILDLLRVESRPVGSIADHFDVSRPAISKHLKVLRESRLVVETKQGRTRICQLNAAPLRDVHEWIGGYRAFWNRKLERLKRHVESAS